MTFEGADNPMFGMTSVTGEVLHQGDGVIMKASQNIPSRLGAVARFYAEYDSYADLTIDQTLDRLSFEGAVPDHEREIIWCALLDLKMGKGYSGPRKDTE